MTALKPYAKALVLLAIIALSAIAQVLGLDVGLDVGHYIGLLASNFMVWLVPNAKYPVPDEQPPMEEF